MFLSFWTVEHYYKIKMKMIGKWAPISIIFSRKPWRSNIIRKGTSKYNSYNKYPNAQGGILSKLVSVVLFYHYRTNIVSVICLIRTLGVQSSETDNYGWKYVIWCMGKLWSVSLFQLLCWNLKFSKLPNIIEKVSTKAFIASVNDR